jgi:phytoene desaturase
MTLKNKKAIIIGAGLAGLSASCYLAKAGFEVQVFEKNAQAGGRAGLWQKDGFRFDLGPSWYWMPEVFEDFFAFFNKKTSDYFDLVRIDPSYKVFFADGQIQVPVGQQNVENLFESLEIGAGAKLHKFLKEAKYKYDLGMNDYAKRPSLSITEFLEPKLLLEIFRLNLFQSLGKQIKSQFKHPWLQDILCFPSLFLGSTADNTPSLYSLMNYADLAIGSFYPINKTKTSGGIYELIRAVESLAIELGVKFNYNQPVEQILVENDQLVGVRTSNGDYHSSVVISGADYHFTEQILLPQKYRRYSQNYWNTRVMCPSSLLFYAGLDCRLPNLEHHNLFFDRDFELHSNEIYIDPKHPTDPLMYVCVASKTDPSCAIKGGENLFVLIPFAPNLEDNQPIRDKYWKLVVQRIEQKTGIDITKHLIVKRDFSQNDFVADYNSYKGNAYGLANILMQTAFLKPKLKSKLNGLYYTGQLTAPGPGMPTCIISGQIVSKMVQKEYGQ